ncbi:MAG: hypothetical protein KME42_09110 [Tildeniella nuda ZEHNDER 1965/U140]|nr:hypothetical protein [Tildeniella nuda ZEHNDER 1965/U140]
MTTHDSIVRFAVDVGLGAVSVVCFCAIDEEGEAAGEGLRGDWLAGAAIGEALVDTPGGSVTEDCEQATVIPASAANARAPATASTEALGFIEVSSWKSI